MSRLKTFLTRYDSPAWKDVAAILVTFGIGCYLLLGRIPLLEPDEGRYAEIPREMLERGDFITPTLNYVKYFEKPPLLYWLNALSMSLFGQNEFAARLACASCGLLAILLTWFVGKKLFDRRTGIWSALVLGTSLGFIPQARINLTDMVLTLFLSAALGFFAIACREGEAQKGRYYYLAYASAALAILAKGLIGIVLPAAILFWFLLLTGRWRLLKEMRLVSGLVLLLMITSPWFIAVSLRNPEFPRFFFIHEHFERYLTKVHHRYEPPWFFIPILLGIMLPWALLLPAAVKDVWRQRRSEKGESALFLLIWAVIIFLFFSASSSKLVPYILPVIPALAILMGRLVAGFIEGETTASLRVPVQIAGALFILSGVGAAAYPFVAPRPYASPVQGAVLALLFIAAGVSILVASRNRTGYRLFLSLAAASYLIILVAPQVVLPGIAERKSYKSIALLINEKAGQDAVMASVGYTQGLPFYTGRREVVVNNPGELEFGSNQGDHSDWFINQESLLKLWAGPAEVYALVRNQDLDILREKGGAPVVELARQGKKILVVNRSQGQGGCGQVTAP